MKRFHATRILLAGCLASLTVSTAIAQKGDRKGQVMNDPIPADQIPPSPYLSLEEAMKEFKIAPGYVIEPVAAGKDVYMSLALSFDANGRAWSCEMRSYMPNLDGKGENTPNGRIRVLEDTNGDGKVDKTTTFLDDLVLPRAVAVTSDGCLYTSGTTLYFIKRNGLRPVGKPIVIDPKYAVGGNPEHKANGLLYGHDNWYYNAKSSARYRRINGKWIKEKTQMRGQWGITKDNSGHLYYNTNSILAIADIFPPMFLRGNPDYQPNVKTSPVVGSNETNPRHMTPGVNRAYVKGTLDSEGRLRKATSACGIVIYRGDNFPKEKHGMAFVCEPVGDLIKAVKISRDELNHPKGSHPYGKDDEFLTSTDEWFLPCNLYTAPDGTLWMVDMYFGVIQHKAYMSSYLRKQYKMRNLDKPGPHTGRIYRIRYQKNKVSAVPRMEGLPASELVQFLSHANGTIRDIAQRLIVESGDTSVTNALTSLASKHSQPLGQIHALWTLDGLGKTNVSALLHGLKSTNHYVINNTLDIIARNRINTPTLQKAILSLTNKPQTLHARIKTMAAAGLADQALKLTLTSKNIPFINEAFMSGLGAETVAFRKRHPKITNAQLDNLLTTVAQAITNPELVKASPGAHLKGAKLKSFKRGKNIYNKVSCMGCHGNDGKGLANLGPPLDQSEWVTKSPERLAKVLLHGLKGPITVNGIKYEPAMIMPGLNNNSSISNRDLADLMNYIRNAWSNKAPVTTEKFVKKVRAATKNQKQPFEAKDLQ